MYRAITFSASREKVDIEKALWFPFPGFDGNGETAQMAYARYFIHRLGRYSELAEHGEHTDFNSHFPSLDHYRGMLRLWKKQMGKSHDLKPDQIRTLLGL